MSYRASKLLRRQEDINHQAVAQNRDEGKQHENKAKNVHNKRVLRRKLGPMVTDNRPQAFREMVHMSGPYKNERLVLFFVTLANVPDA